MPFICAYMTIARFSLKESLTWQLSSRSNGVMSLLQSYSFRNTLIKKLEFGSSGSNSYGREA
jgi:hypothetical protein